MGLEGSAAGIVLGFREESWPKGHGYLYWRDPSGKEIALQFCNLQEPLDERVRAMFENALKEICARRGLEPADVGTLFITTENMSALAQQLLQQAIAQLAS